MGDRERASWALKLGKLHSSLFFTLKTTHFLFSHANKMVVHSKHILFYHTFYTVPLETMGPFLHAVKPRLCRTRLPRSHCGGTKTDEFVKTDRIENWTTDANYFVSQTDGSFFFCIQNMFSFFVTLQAIIVVQQKLFHSCWCFLHHTAKYKDVMFRKSRNEDKNNIDHDIDVCRHWSSNYYAIGSRHAAQSKQT